jgi:hypothetical protein
MLHPILSQTLRLINAEQEDSAPLPDRSAQEAREREALDAYSRVIVRVAEELGPAVVNLRGFGVRVPLHARRIPADQSSRRPRLGPVEGPPE